jgi:amicyanin
MKKEITILVVLIIVAIAAYFLVFGMRSNSPATTPTQDQANKTENTNPPTPPAPMASKVTIDIKGMAFNPANIIIKTGTTVTWTNEDSAPHTVTSDSGSLLNSPKLSKGQSFSFTFTSAGSLDYHCAVHPMMKGKIIVQD